MREGGIKHDGGLFEKHDGFRGFLEELPKPSEQFPVLRKCVELLEKYFLGGDPRVAEAMVEIVCENYEKLVCTGKATEDDRNKFLGLRSRYAALYEFRGWADKWGEQAKEFERVLSLDPEKDLYRDVEFWENLEARRESLLQSWQKLLNFVGVVKIDKLD